MIYKDPSYIGKTAAIIFLANNPTREQIGNLLIAMSFHERDLDFALKTIIRYCYDEDVELQGLSLLCLSHLAKFHDDMPVGTIVKVFEDVINSDRKNVGIIQSRMSDALNDFYTFCPAVFKAIKDKHKAFLTQIDLGIDLNND